jgi:hypothetical protein
VMTSLSNESTGSLVCCFLTTLQLFRYIPMPPHLERFSVSCLAQVR